MPHRHVFRAGEGRLVRGLPHHRPSEGEEARLRHPPDHGPAGASLLRFLRLPGVQFLRPELPLRHARGVQAPGGRRPRQGHRRGDGHRPQPQRGQRGRGPLELRRHRPPVLLLRSAGPPPRLGLPLLRLRQGRDQVLPPVEREILDGGIPHRRFPFRRRHLDALLGPRPRKGFRGL